MEEQSLFNKPRTNILSYLSTIEKTLLIACVTFLAYLVAYIYKVSYLSFYDIPLVLTKVTLEDIIFSSIGMILIIGVMGIVMLIIISSKTNEGEMPKFIKTTFRTTVIVSTLMFGVLSAFIVIFVLLSQKFKIIALSLLFLVYIFLTFGLPMYFHRNEKSIKLRFKKYYTDLNTKAEKRFNEQLIKRQDEGLLGLFLKPPVLGIYVYFISIFISMLIAAGLGTTVASNKEAFYVLNENNQTFLMVEIYEDQLVLVSINEQKNITTGSIRVLTLSDFKKLSYQQIGKLNIYKTELKK